MRGRKEETSISLRGKASRDCCLSCWYNLQSADRAPRPGLCSFDQRLFRKAWKPSMNALHFSTTSLNAAKGRDFRSHRILLTPTGQDHQSQRRWSPATTIDSLRACKATNFKHGKRTRSFHQPSISITAPSPPPFPFSTLPS